MNRMQDKQHHSLSAFPSHRDIACESVGGSSSGASKGKKERSGSIHSCCDIVDQKINAALESKSSQRRKSISSGPRRKNRHTGLLMGVSKLISPSSFIAQDRLAESGSLPGTPTGASKHRRMASDTSTETDEASLTASFRIFRVSKISKEEALVPSNSVANQNIVLLPTEDAQLSEIRSFVPTEGSLDTLPLIPALTVLQQQRQGTEWSRSLGCANSIQNHKDDPYAQKDVGIIDESNSSDDDDQVLTLGANQEKFANDIKVDDQVRTPSDNLCKDDSDKILCNINVSTSMISRSSTKDAVLPSTSCWSLNAAGSQQSKDVETTQNDVRVALPSPSSSSRHAIDSLLDALRLPLPLSRDLSCETFRSNRSKDTSRTNAAIFPNNNEITNSDSLVDKSTANTSIPTRISETSLRSCGSSIAESTENSSLVQAAAEKSSFVLPALTFTPSKTLDPPTTPICSLPINVEPLSPERSESSMISSVSAPLLPSMASRKPALLYRRAVSAGTTSQEISKPTLKRFVSLGTTVSSSRMRSLGPIDVDSVQELYGDDDDSTCSLHASLNNDTDNGENENEKAAFAAEEVDSYLRGNKNDLPPDNIAFATMAPAPISYPTLLERLFLLSNCETKMDNGYYDSSPTTQNDSSILSVSTNSLLLSASTAMSLISRTSQTQNETLIMKAGDGSAMCMCGTSTRSVMSTITEGSSFPSTECNSSGVVTVQSMASGVSEGPVDVDEFISKDSYYLYEDHEIILDETEFSRGIAGYEVGFEPDVIWDYDSCKLRSAFSRPFPIYEELDGVHEEEDDEDFEHLDAGKCNNMQANSDHRQKIHIREKETIVQSEQPNLTVPPRNSNRHIFSSKKKKHTTCRTSMFSI